MNISNKDYICDVIDEIALEGLDGITLEALWLRLTDRPRFIFKPIDDPIKKFLWRLISQLSNVAFYSLPVPREKLIIHNRLEHVDSNGNFYEPEDAPTGNYPHCPIEDKGIMGSCSTYKERQDISEIVRLEDYNTVVSRGNSLVIVADQITRNKALCSMDFNPLTELGVIQYCILERIGRSRYYGEVTQGKRGLQVVTEDSKMLYYFRKLLVKNKLVMKQLFYMKVKKQTSTGSLIHLPRFYSEIKTRQDTDAKKLIESLKNMPQKQMPIKSIKSTLNIELKKILLKYPHNFKTMNVPYRSVMTTFKPNDWKMKSTGEEKSVRVVRLINSNLNLNKEEDEDEDDEEEIGLMDENRRRLDRCLMRQAYSLVEQAGPGGVKQSTLGNLLAVPSLQARSICKHLVKKKLVRTVLIDVGRQRISHFYCAKFESSDYTPSMEVRDEKTKLLEAININAELCEDQNMIDSAPSEEPSCSKGSETLKDQLTDEIDPKETEADKTVSIPKPADDECSVPLDNNEIEAEIIIKPIGEKLFASLTEEIKDCENSIETGLTARMLKRASLIVQAINHHKVIQDYQKIQKLICEEEELAGLKQSIDRKTIQRLIDKLESDGLIRIITVNLKGHGREKNLLFICHPTVTKNHSEIQSAIEQAKMKLPITSAHTKKSDMKKHQDSKRLKLPTYKYDIRAGRRYGFKPKYIRMRILHIYMFYLIYGYDGDINLDQSCKLDIIKKLNLDDSLREEMSTVYSTEIDWKMFLPPLPIHLEYPEGWCLLSDVLLRLPLILFVSIVNVSYDIPGLMDYVEHPLKKYFLVKHLPQEIIHHLTMMRKYIFVISEIVYRLAFIGVAQMGPQKLKEKDQVFIYLNKNAVLYNTIPSDVGYNQISQNKSYETINYHFSSLDDLESYWYDLWNFAMNTNLGIRNTMTGQAVVVESVNTKKELLAAIQPKTVEEAKYCDVGYLPGDHLGAAGLDSDMFVHLKRNWYWTGKKSEDSIQKSILYPPALKKLDSRPAKRKRSHESTTAGTSSQPPSVPIDRPKKQKLIDNTYFKLSSAGRKSRVISKKKTRIVRQRRTKFARKPYYDQQDKDALSRMVKLRVDWTPIEDNLLLICKVASLYLVTDKKRHVVKNFCAVREILHSTYPSSRNKTSRACQRRIRYMMRNSSTAHSVYLCLEEIKQDPEINDKFHRSIEKLDALLKSQGQGPKGYQAEYDKIFISLVTMLFKKLKTINHWDRAHFELTLPDSLADFLMKFKVVVPRTLTSRYGSFAEVQKLMDIFASVINTVIHSSLCCSTDKTSYSQQLFYIYKQYPDKLLRAVMTKCRAMSIVSCRKKYKRWKTAGHDCLPLASSPYQLSISYLHILQARYQYYIYSSCYDNLKSIINDKSNAVSSNSNKRLVVLDVQSGGQCAYLVELFSAGIIETSIEFPDQLIILDPQLSETEESYKLIMKRFREVLSIIKDARKKEKNALFDEDEEYDEDDDDDQTVDDESEPYFDPFNSKNKGVASAASRLALYMMRDEPLNHVDERVQHAHDYFVLNPCKVSVQLDGDDVVNNIFEKEKKLKIISDVKRIATFPMIEMENDAIVDCLKTEFSEKLTASMLTFLESKGELGASLVDIKGNFFRTVEQLEIVNLLSALVDKQYILRTGVVTLRYVHFKFANHWLVKSFFMHRVSRDKMDASNTNSSYAISFAQKNSPVKWKLKKRLAVDTNLGNLDHEVLKTNEDDEPPVKKIKSSETAPLADIEKDLVGLSDHEKQTIQENDSLMSIDESPQRKGEENNTDIFTDNIPSENKILELNDSSKYILGEVNADCGTDEGHNLLSTSSDADISSISPCSPKVNDGLNKEEGAEALKEQIYSRHYPAELLNQQAELINDQVDALKDQTEPLINLALPEEKQKEPVKQRSRVLMKTTKKKWVTLPDENYSKFANIDSLDVKYVNVLLRPWIKVDGTLNRRVLDRLLGSVLGHSLTYPGISVQRLQERLSPALQPVHTFELLEILREIGCIKLITMKKSWKCLLNSERANFVIESAIGLESSGEVLIDPEPLAICKLGNFIGDKNYNIDYLDALMHSKDND